MLGSRGGRWGGVACSSSLQNQVQILTVISAFGSRNSSGVLSLSELVNMTLPQTLLGLNHIRNRALLLLDDSCNPLGSRSIVPGHHCLSN